MKIEHTHTDRYATNKEARSAYDLIENYSRAYNAALSYIKLSIIIKGSLRFYIIVARILIDEFSIDQEQLLDYLLASGIIAIACREVPIGSIGIML